MIHRAEFGDGVTIYNSITYRGTDQIGRLCRKLETGTLECYRGSMLCLVIDVEERKKIRLRETDKKGLHREKYTEFLIDNQKRNKRTDETRPHGLHGRNEIQGQPLQ